MQQCSTPYCLNDVKVKYNKKCYKCRKRVWRLKNPDKDAYYNIKHCAKTRGVPFHITWEEFLNWPLLDTYLKFKGTDSKSLSLDRIKTIDEKGNVKGYTIDNIQLLELGENVLKGHRERKQAFQAHIYCPREPNDPF